MENTLKYLESRAVSIKDIVSDMEAAEAMINTLYETLKTALQ